MEESWRSLARLLIGMGVILILMGLILYGLSVRGWSWPRLPGDFVIERPGFRFYFPLGTSLAISLLLSLLFWIFRRFGQGGSF
jgi:uncharacterized membrane protein